MHSCINGLEALWLPLFTTMPATYQASVNNIIPPPQRFNDVLTRTSEVLLDSDDFVGRECTYPVRNSSCGNSQSQVRQSKTFCVDLLRRQRDDIAVPSDLLDDATAALLANGWTFSPTKLPLPHTPDRCRSGWDIVGKYSRLLRYPASFGTRPHELLVLPSCFIGLEHEPLDDNTKFFRFGQNIYCPSAYLMATSVARTHILSKLPCLGH
jgi:hypothetical protein